MKRFRGKGVLKAVKNIESTIAPALVGMDTSNQRAIDTKLCELDGTPNKSHLGANALLPVSLAVARAAASASRLPLYKYLRSAFLLPQKNWRMPAAFMNVLNGGRHADNNLSIQEFMIVPRNSKFSERVRIGSEIFHALHEILHDRGFTTSVGDEGGFAPALGNNEQALKLLVLAIKRAGYVPGKHVMLALDVAASEFHRGVKYYFFGPREASTAEDLITTFKSWCKKYPLLSIEDPLAEDDWKNWKIATTELKKTTWLVGDDLFVTNVSRIEKGIKSGVATAVLIKPNQIGTLSETIDAITLAQKNKYEVIVSHRSGETADTFIADLAVAVGAEGIKTGSLSRSERVEKYNRLMQIEEEIGS